MSDGDVLGGELTERQERLKEDFVRARGYWAPIWDSVLRLDTEYFEAYLNFSAVPWRTGPLEPKMKELIYIAIDASTTHLYEPGLRIHVQNALRYGATKEEIMEVFELTSVLGVHTISLGVPVLMEELESQASEDGQKRAE